MAKEEVVKVKILNISFIKLKQDDVAFQKFLIKILLSADPYNSKITAQIDDRQFTAYKKLNSLENVNVVFADVFVDLSIPREEEVYSLTVDVVDNFTKKTTDTKTINVKVDNQGGVGETEEEIEVNTCSNCLVDKKYFFEKYKQIFGKLTKRQVYNMDLILDSICDYYKTEKKICDISQLSYILATTKHETANTFEPINEYGGVKYYEQMYDPVLGKNEKRRNMAKENENIDQGDGVKYHGRGFVQLTWKKNYRRMKEKFGVDLVNYPEKALDLELAIKILIYGSESGSFTTLKLSDFINKKKKDYYNARKVINGLDQAKKVQGYATEIEKCIKVL